MSDPTWIEPEVLPPEPDRTGQRQARGRGQETPPGRGPLVLAGLLIDLLDFVTMGPAGRRFGLALGFVFCFCILSLMRLPFRKRLLWSLCAGLYCSMPGSERIPLATLFSLFVPR